MITQSIKKKNTKIIDNVGGFERSPRPRMSTKQLDSGLHDRGGLRPHASAVWSRSSLVLTPSTLKPWKFTIYMLFPVVIVEEVSEFGS